MRGGERRTETTAAYRLYGLTTALPRSQKICNPGAPAAS